MRIITELDRKQQAVAKKAGIKPQAFSDMLNGRKLIKLCDVTNIADALGVTPNDLYGIKKEESEAV